MRFGLFADRLVSGHIKLGRAEARPYGSEFILSGRAADYWFLGNRWRDQGGHFADHGQHEALVAI